MANWRRGFFRLRVLLSILWVILIGAVASGGILDPYVSETLFTFNKDDQLEVVPLYGEKYSKMLSDERAGYYTRIGFKDDAPNIFYMAPNAFEVIIRGKTFEVLMSNERLNNPDHEGLVTALMDFISKNDLDLQPPITSEEVRASIPQKLELQYKEPSVKDQVRNFAIATQAQALEEARQRNIIGALSGMFIPPLVLLALGAALGWVLKGFNRKQPV